MAISTLENCRWCEGISWTNTYIDESLIRVDESFLSSGVRSPKSPHGRPQRHTHRVLA